MSKMLCKIAEVKAIEVLDSRGNPTVRAKVMLSDGKSGEATVPSGASTGKYEAYEKRDGDDVRYGGKGVLGAVDAVNSTIAKRIVGTELTSQYKLDSILCELDGAENKSNLGANAILAVSVAYARACAQHYGLRLCEYLGGVLGKCNKMPCPMMNVLNGGAHSKNNIDVQEFMIVPVGIDGYKERIRASAEVYKALGKRLSMGGHVTSVGDEGGYAPFRVFRYPMIVGHGMPVLFFNKNKTTCTKSQGKKHDFRTIFLIHLFKIRFFIFFLSLFCAFCTVFLIYSLSFYRRMVE